MHTSNGTIMIMRSVGLSIFLFSLLMIPARPANAQAKYGTQVSAEALFPSGSFGQYFNTGYGIGVGFSMADGKTLSYHLRLGYGRLVLDNNALNASSDFNREQGRYDVGGAITVYPILFGVTFFPDKEGSKPYGLLEFGLYMSSQKFDGGTYTSPGGSQSVFYGRTKFRAEPGFNAGMGVLLPLSPGKSLDLGVRYNFVKDSQYYNLAGTGASSTYLGFSQYFSLSVGLDFSY